LTEIREFSLATAERAVERANKTPSTNKKAMVSIIYKINMKSGFYSSADFLGLLLIYNYIYSYCR
jgi:hypothetical protein